MSDGTNFACTSPSSIPGAGLADRVVTAGSAPGSPVLGDVYFDTGDDTLYTYDGSGWVASNDGGTASSVPATGVTAGTFGANVFLPVAQLDGDLNPLTQLNGGVCANGDVLQSNGTAFTCVTEASVGDQLGLHTATQDLDLDTFQLVGNGGSSGISILSNGNVGVGNE